MPSEHVSIAMPEGPCRAFVARPDGVGRWPGVIFFMDGIGYRPVLFEMAERIARAGYVVLLPDLYFRAGGYEPLDPKALFSDPSQRAKLAPLFATTGNARAGGEDTRAFLATLASRPEVLGEKVGVTGYCMGGGIALTAAARHPERVAAAASFHGGRLATDDANSPHRSVAKIRARVLVAGADKDESFPLAQKETLARAFADAHVDARVEIWPGALHGWTMRDFPIHHPEAAERHFRELVALFDESLKPA